MVTVFGRESSAIVWAAILVLAGAVRAQDGARDVVVVNGPVVVAAQPAAAPVAPPAAGGGVSGLHVPQEKNVSFPYNLTDGAGYVWDIQNYGSVGSGTNSALSYAMRLRVNGGYVYSTVNAGWTGKNADEVEIGPMERGGIRTWRRIKVFKDAGLARWLDIYENTTSQPMTVQALLRTYTSYPITRTVTNSGGGSFGSDDWGFLAETQSGDVPALLFILGDGRGDCRPSVQIQNTRVFLDYNLTVPANRTAIICYFVSQDRSADNHLKRMRDFQAGKYLADLPAEVRKLIVNFQVTGGGFDTVALQRSALADTVILAAGDPIYGEVTNRSFTVEGVLGPVKVDAENVIGMAAAKEPEGAMRVVLADGQIVTGRLPADDKLALSKAFGDLTIPFGRIRQWSYRISKDRPLDMPFRGPYIKLRTGDQFVFDPNSIRLELVTKHGIVALDGTHILKIQFEPGAGGDRTSPAPRGTMPATAPRADPSVRPNAPHRVLFLNGSSLAGLIRPDRISPALKLGPRMEFSRNLIWQIQFAAEGHVDATLTRVVLVNDDTLFGELTEEKYRLKTDYGELEVRPANIRSVTFDKSNAGLATVHLWNSSVLRGRFDRDELAFQIMPGPAMKVHVSQCASVHRTQALPPEEIRKQVEKLIGQLGAESYRDRQSASEALVRLGPSIVPLLQKHQKAAKDPEVRTRIEEVIERLGGKKAAPGTPSPPTPVRPVINLRAGG